MPTGSFPDATVAALQAVLDAQVGPSRPGIAATVMSADGAVWSGAAGTADGEHPVEVGSKFATGSVGKMIIAAEVMRLADDGLLRLDDPVSNHLPAGLGFDTDGATIRDLLAMESGFPDPVLLDGPDMETDPLRQWTPAEILASVPAERTGPGVGFSYSNTNYILLGLVIEEVTAKSTSAVLRSSILADPGFAAMAYQPEERPVAPLALPFAEGHVRPDILAAGGGFLPTMASVSAGEGAGAIATDSRALALFGYLLFGGKLISEDALAAMTAFDEESRYGLGVFNHTTNAPFGTLAIGHGGDDPGGYAASLTALPSKGIVISVLTNSAGSPLELALPIAQQLAAVPHP